MSFYPPKINERMQNLSNAGKAEGANAVGANGCFSCGGALRLSLRIDPETKEILDAKFQTNGCGYMIAAADVLVGLVRRQKLTDIHGANSELLTADVKKELGDFLDGRENCLKICVDTLQSAFEDFRAFQLESFQGEKALICTCFGVSEDEIESRINTGSLRSVEDVTAACNAGGGCGSCQPLIQEMIDSVSGEPIY